MKFDINICPVCGDNTEKIEEDYMIGNVHLDCFLKKEGLS
tara:strand:- start:1931 stop:2050 length:120 start_codon:yes stop_codon:yes gene_type:complete